MPATAPWAAACSPTASATASSSSSTQRRQRRARGELVAAVDAALRLDRVAELAQPVDVAAQGADRHLEPVGQLRARPVAVGLQQGQQAQRPELVSAMPRSLPQLRTGTGTDGS